MNHLHRDTQIAKLQDSTRANSGLFEDKYHPRSLDDMALDPLIRREVEAWLASGHVPHFVFAGPPGVGKTTLADVILERMFPSDYEIHVCRVDASQDGTVDKVREIKKWIEGGGGIFKMLDARWHCAILFDEADGLTPEAQRALKVAMATYSGRATFIFATNDLKKMIQPIQSRCNVIDMTPPPLEERVRFVERVLQAEEVGYDRASVETFVQPHPDLRPLLRAIQKAILLDHGRVFIGAASAADDENALEGQAAGGAADPLLGAMLTIFKTEAASQLPTGALLARLVCDDAEHWESLTPRILARRLRPYNIRSEPMWLSVDGGPKRTVQGYHRVDLEAAICGDLLAGPVN